MPVRMTHNPRKAPTQDQIDVLFTGHDFFKSFDSDEHRRQTWLEHKESLMELWLSEDKNVGRRPSAWWLFDAPSELRRRIGGTGTASRDSADCPAWARKIRFGCPAVFDSDYDESDPPRFEEEVNYLRRHGLLTQREKMALVGVG
jgi:hypothetical protein